MREKSCTRQFASWDACPKSNMKRFQHRKLLQMNGCQGINRCDVLLKEVCCEKKTKKPLLLCHWMLACHQTSNNNGPPPAHLARHYCIHCTYCIWFTIFALQLSREKSCRLVFFMYQWKFSLLMIATEILFFDWTKCVKLNSTATYNTDTDDAYVSTIQ